MFDDFPRRLADLLEAFAGKIRALTVDRLARLITLVTLGLLALSLVALSMIFFLIGLSRILGELVYRACDCSLATEISYAIIGGLFLAIAALLWTRRTRSPSGGDS